ncbi:hypothetical protein PPACK8108_LOCUS21446 [Phakopsora pachyrhizi]|uniref:Uncharacterized protein n=1 Tax=Phakopsora pachyrhizi TaxID=170000 RepID=A0AAV0BJK6_PHAPC|nr:hypothetical protein PPACK8108_LOCUS21446 [Phakopsora pachyrhizi]
MYIRLLRDLEVKWWCHGIKQQQLKPPSKSVVQTAGCDKHHKRHKKGIESGDRYQRVGQCYPLVRERRVVDIVGVVVRYVKDKRVIKQFNLFEVLTQYSDYQISSKQSHDSQRLASPSSSTIQTFSLPSPSAYHSYHPKWTLISYPVLPHLLGNLSHPPSDKKTRAIEELGSLQKSLSDYHTVSSRYYHNSFHPIRPKILLDQEDLLQVNEDEIHDCSDPVSILRPSMLDEDQGLSSQPLKNTSKSVTNQSVDKLIAEWEPEPLVEPIPVTTQLLLCPPIIIGIPDVRPKILYGEPALRFTESLEDEATINLKDIRTVTNLASINFSILIGDKHVKL